MPEPDDDAAKPGYDIPEPTLDWMADLSNLLMLDLMREERKPKQERGMSFAFEDI